MIHANQQAYYDAINASTERVNSAPFIDFMLGEILSTVEKNKGEPKDNSIGIKFTEKLTERLTENAAAILHLIERNPFIPTSEMARQLGVSRQTIAKTIATLKRQKLLRRIGPDKGGHWEATAKSKPPI
ncbi:MAG: MarR family transcriptional regulator [Puniceicoccales bacterium]|jgi:predicted HTH transcriptional regulator|nr:MarR family transcriptional regulator [Puniceicoccales bacterium]